MPSQGSDCPICGGDEWIISIDEKGHETASPCECRERIMTNRRLSFADLPEKYKNISLTMFNDISIFKLPESTRIMKFALSKIKKYLSEFHVHYESGLGLYFYSETKGSGKSTMAAGIANELVKKQSMQVRYAESTKILNELKATYDKDSNLSASKLFKYLIMTDILVIDDFGTERESGWVNDTFYHIVNERYVNKRVTIFTSNNPIEQLKYDQRIISRVNEMTFKIAFPEEDIRRHIAKERDDQMMRQMRMEEMLNENN